MTKWGTSFAALAAVLFVLAACGAPEPTTAALPDEPPPSRTPLPAPSETPEPGSEVPATATSTANAVPAAIALHWPPNHATLHSAALPDFQFDAPSGPFVTRLTLHSPDLGFAFEIPDVAAYTPTPMTLADGLYTWQVKASRISGVGLSSEVWDFRIDTSCQCTDTPMP